MKKGVDIMKSRYIIGFFAVFVAAGLILTAGYQFTYNKVLERQAAQPQDEAYGTESIAEEGGAVKNDENEGYYLRELHGFVAVYLSDKETVYEFTEIPVSDLPEEVRQEVAEGKYISDMKELYAFLENYSS